MNGRGLAPGRLWAAVTVAAAVAATAGSPAVAEEGRRPAIWSGASSAAAVQVLANTEPGAVPVQTLVDLRIPDAETTWDSTGTASARASSVYPGASGTGGAELLCQFAASYGAPCPEPLPPDYPLTAFASHPAEPDAQTPTGFATAHADQDLIEAIARPGNVVPLDALAEVVAVGGASASSRQEFVDGELVVAARTTLSDVVVAGGALRIGGLEVSSTSRTRADGGAESETNVTITGVRTAAGAVVVDERGLTVGEQQPGGDAIRQVNEALAAALEGSGVEARLVGASNTSDAGHSRGEAIGMVLHLRRTVDGPPVPEADRVYRTYVASLALGQVGTQAFASDEPFGLEPEAGLLLRTDGADRGTAGGEAVAPDAAPAPAAPRTGTGGAAQPQVAPPATEGSAEEGGFALLSGAAARAVTRGYAGAALAAFALVVAARRDVRRLVA